MRSHLTTAAAIAASALLLAALSPAVAGQSDPQDFSQIERGLSTPSLISLYNVANALGTSVDTFLSQPPRHGHSMVSHAGERPGYNVAT